MIAPPSLHGAIAAALADLGAVADAAEALDAPIGVLLPTDAKGLEFDHVVVVEPARLVHPGLSRAAAALRHAHPRDPTLTVVHADGLPEALAP